MSRDVYVLYGADDADRWRLIAVRDGEPRPLALGEVAGEAGPTPWLGPVVSAIEAERRGGGELVLALPSAWCLCAGIDTSELPRRGRDDAMAYRLEERLPIAAEAFIASFVHGGANSALGVCVERSRIEPIVAALEAAALPVEHICPAATLAAQQVADAHDGAVAAVLIGGADSVDVLLFDPSSDDGPPYSWTVLPARPEAIETYFVQITAGGVEAPTAVVMGVSDEVNDALMRAGVTVMTCGTGNADDLAAMTAARIAGHRVKPWIDLRRGPLAVTDPLRHLRVPLLSALIATIIATAAMTAGFHLRAAAYAEQAARYTAQIHRLFAAALPDQTPPSTLAAMRARLSSERRKLSDLASLPTVLDPEMDALALLHRTLTPWKQTPLLRLLTIDIDEGRIHLEGEARAHQDADQLAALLRRVEHLEVSPASSSRSRRVEGVSFSIAAEHVRAGRGMAEGR